MSSFQVPLFSNIIHSAFRNLQVTQLQRIIRDNFDNTWTFLAAKIPSTSPSQRVSQQSRLSRTGNYSGQRAPGCVGSNTGATNWQRRESEPVLPAIMRMRSGIIQSLGKSWTTTTGCIDLSRLVPTQKMNSSDLALPTWPHIYLSTHYSLNLCPKWNTIFKSSFKARILLSFKSGK